MMLLRELDINESLYLRYVLYYNLLEKCQGRSVYYS